jgi:hypothetical protein
MSAFVGSCIAATLAVVIFAVASIYLGANYSYRWNVACAAVGGVKMENTSGSTVCIKGPVQIVTIAARPW